MIINKPILTKVDTGFRLSSVIEFDSVYKAPKTLWFEIHTNNVDEISTRSDSFLCALFLLSMSLGETINVKGYVSPKLVEGINKYQAIFHGWFPEQYKVISIVGYDETPHSFSGAGRAATFTGGVDSFFTLWSDRNIKKTQARKDRGISHVLFIQGFDTKVDNVSGFVSARDSFKDFLSREGISMLSVCTNLREFTDAKVIWDFAHGSGISAVALLFLPVINSLQIASSYQTKQLHPWGSHPETDPLLSTELFNIVHHGVDKTRVQKIIDIAHWDKINNNLRVCSWLRSDGLKNCGRCSKCVRTMIALDIAGVLDNINTFDSPLTRKKIRRSLFLYSGGKIFVDEIILYAQKVGRRDVVFDLKFAIIRSYIPAKLIYIIQKLNIGSRLLRSSFAKKIYFRLVGK